MNYKLLTAFIALLIMAGTACKKVDFGDINNDPNRTTEPNTSALLSNVLSTLGNSVWDAGGQRTIAGLYGQYFSETQYTDASRYTRTTANWDGTYAGVLYDLQNIINYNSDPATAEKATINGSNANQIATARILKAYAFWQLADLWGDLPYFEALKGVGTIPYDKLEDVYPDLLKELKEAVAQFDGGLPARGDLLFFEDIGKWKKFANSLRMMVALRLTNANASLGQSEFTSALNDPAGIIESNLDNASLEYPGGNYLNPFYNYYNVTQRDDYAVCSTLLDWLNGHNDRRNQKFGTSTVGFPYGLTRDDAVTYANNNTDYARLISLDAAGPQSPIVVLGAANVYLARAEAANIGWTGENVTDMYNNGIEASWVQWGVFDAAAIATYKANADVTLGSGNKAQKIAQQQWIAYYPNGLEAWSLWRRTGYPVLNPAPDRTTIPQRMSYGPNEVQLNPDNYNPAAEKYSASDGPDSQFAKLWWAK